MLSIIMPVLNEAAGVVRTLAALQPLRQRGAELIVVDGGSTDGTVERCRPLADIVLAAPPGRARQMNAGAAAAHAGVLLFLHADTLLPDQADTLVLRALHSHKHWGRFDVRISGTHRLLPVIASLMNLRSRITGVATGDQALFMQRTLFDQLGGFPDQALMEDIALSKKLKQHSHPACLRAKVITSGRRWEARGVWRTIWLMWCLRWRYWRGAHPDDLARSYQ